jgi:hypothetical protein
VGQVFHELVTDRKNQYLMIDSTDRKKWLGQGFGVFPRRSGDQDPPAANRLFLPVGLLVTAARSTTVPRRLPCSESGRAEWVAG